MTNQQTIATACRSFDGVVQYGSHPKFCSRERVPCSVPHSSLRPAGRVTCGIHRRRRPSKRCRLCGAQQPDPGRNKPLFNFMHRLERSERNSCCNTSQSPTCPVWLSTSAVLPPGNDRDRNSLLTRGGYPLFCFRLRARASCSSFLCYARVRPRTAFRI